MKKKNRIYIKEWLALKPYKNHSSTDLYYLKLSNKVYEIMKKEGETFLQFFLEENEIQGLACFLVSYFEDVISQTGLWRSFVLKHEELYEKKLPFYATDDYEEQEINEQDVAFLVWYFLSCRDEDDFLDPEEPLLILLVSSIMEVFEAEYEIAPENENLQKAYELAPESDYYGVRAFIDRILFSSYLFYPDTYEKLLERENELIENYSDNSNLISLMSDARDHLLHRSHTRLLSLKGKNWAAEILGKQHPFYDHLNKMSERVYGFFLYKGQDPTYIYLEHIATSKSFQLKKESFGYADQLQQQDSIMYMGMTNWIGEWWFSGVFFQQEYNPEVIAEEKSNLESKQIIPLSDQEKIETEKILEKHKKMFREYNNSSLIAFMPTEKINSFIKAFTSYCNQSLNLSEKEKAESLKKAKTAGFSGESKNLDEDFAQGTEDGVVFFNPNSGIEMAFGVSSAFPSEENPFFEEEYSEEDVLILLSSKDFSKELALYCIEHYKDKLPFFREETGRQVLENLDFLLRFWKEKYYHTKPALSLI